MWKLTAKTTGYVNNAMKHVIVKALNMEVDVMDLLSVVV
jgi:hypothetical protein